MNAIIERLHQVLGNLVHTYNSQETYVDDTDPWMGILAAAAFAVLSTYHRTKQKFPGQLVFFQDMILPINHVADWRLQRQESDEYSKLIGKYVASTVSMASRDNV